MWNDISQIYFSSWMYEFAFNWLLFKKSTLTRLFVCVFSPIWKASGWRCEFPGHPGNEQGNLNTKTSFYKSIFQTSDCNAHKQIPFQPETEWHPAKKKSSGAGTLRCRWHIYIYINRRLGWKRKDLLKEWDISAGERRFLSGSADVEPGRTAPLALSNLTCRFKNFFRLLHPVAKLSNLPPRGVSSTIFYAGSVLRLRAFSHFYKKRHLSKKLFNNCPSFKNLPFYLAIFLCF